MPDTVVTFPRRRRCYIVWVWGIFMKHKHSLLDSVMLLAIIGIVAGALGGLAIGIVTGRTTSSATSTAK